MRTKNATLLRQSMARQIRHDCDHGNRNRRPERLLNCLRRSLQPLTGGFDYAEH